MPIYQSNDNVLSGVPLGGIGAGKMEILPNGLFNAFTFQNNWSKPLTGDSRYPGILGFHMGVSVESAGSSQTIKKSFLLQTVPVLNVPTVSNIRYEGFFPHARLTYEEPGLGLNLSLEAYSSWSCGDVKDTSLPCAFFELKVKNKTQSPVNFGFIFIGKNISGRWCVGRRNRIVEDKTALHLEFLNEDPGDRDVRQGALRFSFEKKGWQLSFMEYWNAVTKNFSFDPQNISLLGWDTFVQNGELPNFAPGFRATGENQELCGAVSAGATLKPGEEKTLFFTAAWHFPKHPLGHYYSRWFKSAAEVSGYALSRRKSIQLQTKRFEEIVFSLPFPRWFNEALLAALPPFFSSTWHVRDGRFAFYESPVACPLLGTLDVGFYGSIFLSYFFPELEKSQILQFAKAQRKDGYIPHDLGKNRLDLPSDGTTFFQWKDLNPKFILMAYRDFYWSRDKAFLKKIYPHVKRALRWTIAHGHSGGGLPVHEGADQTFDLWEFKGTNAYTASLFLAALLACEKMAGNLGDPEFSKECRAAFLRGRESFEKELWNGRYFGKTCSLSQLNGQWAANLLGLGPIADRTKIKKALATAWKQNNGQSDFGMVNSVLEDGELDTSNAHAKNVWLGMNDAFVSLCISEGFRINDSLKPLRRIWDNVTKLQKNPWSQPDMIDSKTGRYVFGDSYYRNMAIWSIPIAVAQRDKKTAAILNRLRDAG